MWFYFILLIRWSMPIKFGMSTKRSTGWHNWPITNCFGLRSQHRRMIFWDMRPSLKRFGNISQFCRILFDYKYCIRITLIRPHGIGVATGEMCANRVIFKQLLQANAIEFCQIDSARIGGVNEILAVYLMAKKLNGIVNIMNSICEI